jgi:hypothetical protein
MARRLNFLSSKPITLTERSGGMKRTAVVVFVAVASLAAIGCGSTRYSQYARDRHSDEDTLATMTKQDVITLSQAKVSDEVIINQMKASHAEFQLSTQDIIDLVNAGVSDKVIDAMILMEDSSRSDNGVARNYYYPAYYWYAGYPYLYSWYPSFSLGFSVVRYRPFHSFHGFYGARGFRGRR